MRRGNGNKIDINNTNDDNVNNDNNKKYDDEINNDNYNNGDDDGNNNKSEQSSNIDIIDSRIGVRSSESHLSNTSEGNTCNERHNAYLLDNCNEGKQINIKQFSKISDIIVQGTGTAGKEKRKFLWVCSWCCGENGMRRKKCELCDQLRVTSEKVQDASEGHDYDSRKLKNECVDSNRIEVNFKGDESYNIKDNSDCYGNDTNQSNNNNNNNNNDNKDNNKNINDSNDSNDNDSNNDNDDNDSDNKNMNNNNNNNNDNNDDDDRGRSYASLGRLGRNKKYSESLSDSEEEIDFNDVDTKYCESGRVGSQHGSTVKKIYEKISEKKYEKKEEYEMESRLRSNGEGKGKLRKLGKSDELDVFSNYKVGIKRVREGRGEGKGQGRDKGRERRDEGREEEEEEEEKEEVESEEEDEDEEEEEEDEEDEEDVESVGDGDLLGSQAWQTYFSQREPIKQTVVGSRSTAVSKSNSSSSSSSSNSRSRDKESFPDHDKSKVGFDIVDISIGDDDDVNDNDNDGDNFKTSRYSQNRGEYDRNTGGEKERESGRGRIQNSRGYGREGGTERGREGGSEDGRERGKEVPRQMSENSYLMDLTSFGSDDESDFQNSSNSGNNHNNNTSRLSPSGSWSSHIIPRNLSKTVPARSPLKSRNQNNNNNSNNYDDIEDEDDDDDDDDFNLFDSSMMRSKGGGRDEGRNNIRGREVVQSNRDEPKPTHPNITPHFWYVRKRSM